MHLARVHVRVIVLVVDVVCLMLVLSALVVLLAVFIQFSYPFFCSRRYTLYTLTHKSRQQILVPQHLFSEGEKNVARLFSFQF